MSPAALHRSRSTDLALDEDLAVLRRLWTSGGSDEETAPKSRATTVTFGEEWVIPVADLDAAKKHGWLLA